MFFKLWPICSNGYATKTRIASLCKKISQALFFFTFRRTQLEKVELGKVDIFTCHEFGELFRHIPTFGVDAFKS